MTEQRLEDINRLNLLHFSIEDDKNIDWEVVDLPTLQKLDQARHISKVPYRITSNHRELDNPAGFPTDAHRDVPCKAFDIAYSNSHELFRIVYGLMLVGFTRIGINPVNKHVHTDASMQRPQEVLFMEGLV